MGNKALGLLEVQGYSVALAACDKACKQSNVKVVGMDCNNPIEGDNAQIPVVVQVRFVGGIDDVKEALEISKMEAEKYIDSRNINTHFISSYVTQIERIIKNGKVKIK